MALLGGWEGGFTNALSTLYIVSKPKEMSVYDLPPVHTIRPELKIRSTIGDCGGRSTNPGNIVRWYVVHSQKREYIPSKSISVPGGNSTCATMF